MTRGFQGFDIERVAIYRAHRRAVLLEIKQVMVGFAEKQRERGTQAFA
jgi:hypothetical protein